MLKFTLYSHSLSTLLQVLKNALLAIISALSILLILITLASSGLYLVEHDAQPEAFGFIPQALSWATITLTSFEYDNVVGITMVSNMLAILIIILGEGIATLPAGIMASGFTTEIQNRP